MERIETTAIKNNKKHNSNIKNNINSKYSITATNANNIKDSENVD